MLSIQKSIFYYAFLVPSVLKQKSKVKKLLANQIASFKKVLLFFDKVRLTTPNTMKYNVKKSFKSNKTLHMRPKNFHLFFQRRHSPFNSRLRIFMFPLSSH